MTPDDYLDPKWRDVDRVHNWRNYVTAELREKWPQFSEETRRIVAECLQDIANREDWD